MGIPTFAVVLMAVAVPIFLAAFCCFCGFCGRKCEELIDEDVEAPQIQTWPSTITPAPAITKQQKVAKQKTNDEDVETPQIQTRPSTATPLPPIEKRQTGVRRKTNRIRQGSNAALDQDKKSVVEPGKNDEDIEAPQIQTRPSTTTPAPPIKKRQTGANQKTKRIREDSNASVDQDGKIVEKRLKNDEDVEAPQIQVAPSTTTLAPPIKKRQTRAKQKTNRIRQDGNAALDNDGKVVEERLNNDEDIEGPQIQTRPSTSTPAPPIKKRHTVAKQKTNEIRQDRNAPSDQDGQKVGDPPKNVSQSDSPTRPSNTKGKPAPATAPLPVPSTSGGETELSDNQDFEFIKLKSYKYIDLAAFTGGFSNFNLLGEGSFGQVYKGKLPNGEEVAIKKLKRDAGKNAKEFNAEISTISRAQHKHLVKLLGFCVDEGNRLLVFEFVRNNSLRSHLHGEHKNFLSWSNRIKIAIGSAKGLEYLHQCCDCMIIHRDIKADNILLDHNFQPKIADFGLARDISYSVSHISTDPRGTFGYLAPEYVKDRKLTDKSDVFSFGVVLLELITGIKHAFYEDNSIIPYKLAVWLVHKIKKALESGEHKELIDPKLEKEDIDENDLARMIYCAAACVYKPATARPDMRQIVGALRGDIALDRIWMSSDSKFLYEGAPYTSFPL